MKHTSLMLAVSLAVVVAGGVAYAESNGQNQRSTRSKEQVCLDLLAKADERAQNKQKYLDKIDEAVQRLSEIEVPENSQVDPELIEQRKAEAQAKAQELRAKIEEVYAMYESVRPNIDCSDPEEALRTVREARDQIQGGSFVSKYVGELDVRGVISEAKSVREQVKTVFGSLVNRDR